MIQYIIDPIRAYQYYGLELSVALGGLGREDGRKRSVCFLKEMIKIFLILYLFRKETETFGKQFVIGQADEAQHC